MIPVDALRRELVAAKLYDYHHVYRDFLRRRLYIRQQSWHRLSVGKCEVEFIHELSLSDDTVRGRHL